MMEIRTSVAQDADTLRTLYDQAFPTEDLFPLVSALLDCPDNIISLVAVDGAKVVGHVVLTFGSVEDASHACVVALLGPVCVTPARQRQGIGDMLIRDGLKRAAETKASCVLVLGDPAYYSRFGFREESGVVPPYDLPDEWSEAWQGLTLDGDKAKPTGRLMLPVPWLRPNLWQP